VVQENDGLKNYFYNNADKTKQQSQMDQEAVIFKNQAPLEK
jgi:hypothetical protein